MLLPVPAMLLLGFIMVPPADQSPVEAAPESARQECKCWQSDGRGNSKPAFVEVTCCSELSLLVVFHESKNLCVGDSLGAADEAQRHNSLCAGTC